MAKHNILFCGGGTGGHYYPLMAIKNELDKTIDNKKLFYIGSKYGIESKKVFSENMKSLLIPIKGFNRSLSINAVARNSLLLFELFFGLFRVAIFFIKNKPNIVIATGGYASFIPLQIAKMLNVPFFLHEQNSYPGLVTRLFGSKAKKVFTGFSNARNYLKDCDIMFSGNPIYSHNKEDMSISFNNNNKVVVIIGGSQGSVILNEIISECLNSKELNQVNIIWVTGVKHYKNYKHYNDDSTRVLSFVNNMPYIYKMCDLIISRSGAMTVSELLEFKKPSILIPFKFSAENHQLYNAKYLEQHFAALVVQEKDLTKNLLCKKIKEICDSDRVYNSMKENISKIDNPNSIRIICDNITEYLNVI